MSKKPVPPRAILLLIAIALLLLIAGVIVLGLAALLGAMGDVVGSRVLNCIGLGVGVLLAVNLVFLVLVQAFNSVADSDQPSDEPE